MQSRRDKEGMDQLVTIGLRPSSFAPKIRESHSPLRHFASWLLVPKRQALSRYSRFARWLQQ